MLDPHSLNGSFTEDNVVFCLTVDVGNFCKGTIEVREGDDVARLARGFAKEHNLSLKKQLKIETLLKDYLNSRNSPQECPFESDKSLAASATAPSLSKSSYKSSNYGELLYKRSIENQAQKLKHLNGLRSKKEVSFTSGLKSYKSNPGSRKSSVEKDKPKLTDNLIKHELLTQQVWRERLKECSFTPKVNTKKDQKSGDRHLKLYQDAYKLSLKKEKLADEAEVFTHSPKLNPDILNESKEARVERLYNSHLRTEEKRRYQQVEQEKALALDFKPNVGRSPKVARNPANMPIGDFLYSNSSTNSPKLLSSTQSPRNFTPSLNSIKFARNRYLKMYQDMFARLNPNDDRRIKAKADTVELRETEKRIIKVAFNGLDDDIELDFTEFVSRVHFVVSSLDLQTKSKLFQKTPLNVKLKPPRPLQKVNSSEFFARQLASQAAMAAKLEQARSVKEQASVSNCTFSPKTTFYPNRKQRELMRNRSK
mmetsp:Transcript_12424/g.23507  ORF Transcript_12424/g.23507 Transcript_12424/m.23507 type:complete len:481 (+) Transcript_12424:115-1557(+)